MMSLTSTSTIFFALLSLFARQASATSICLGTPIDNSGCSTYTNSYDCNASYDSCAWNSVTSSCQSYILPLACYALPQYNCQEQSGCTWFDSDALTTSDIVLISLNSFLIILTLLVLVGTSHVTYWSYKLHRHARQEATKVMDVPVGP